MSQLSPSRHPPAARPPSQGITPWPTFSAPSASDAPLDASTASDMWRGHSPTRSPRKVKGRARQDRDAEEDIRFNIAPRAALARRLMLRTRPERVIDPYTMGIPVTDSGVDADAREDENEPQAGPSWSTGQSIQHISASATSDSDSSISHSSQNFCDPAHTTPRKKRKESLRGLAFPSTPLRGRNKSRAAHDDEAQPVAVARRRNSLSPLRIFPSLHSALHDRAAAAHPTTEHASTSPDQYPRGMSSFFRSTTTLALLHGNGNGNTTPTILKSKSSITNLPSNGTSPKRKLFSQSKGKERAGRTDRSDKVENDPEMDQLDTWEVIDATEAQSFAELKTYKDKKEERRRSRDRKVPIPSVEAPQVPPRSNSPPAVPPATSRVVISPSTKLRTGPPITVVRVGRKQTTGTTHTLTTKNSQLFNSSSLGTQAWKSGDESPTKAKGNVVVGSGASLLLQTALETPLPPSPVERAWSGSHLSFSTMPNAGFSKKFQSIMADIAGLQFTPSTDSFSAAAGTPGFASGAETPPKKEAHEQLPQTPPVQTQQPSILPLSFRARKLPIPPAERPQLEPPLVQTQQPSIHPLSLRDRKLPMPPVERPRQRPQVPPRPNSPPAVPPAMSRVVQLRDPLLSRSTKLSTGPPITTVRLTRKQTTETTHTLTTKEPQVFNSSPLGTEMWKPSDKSPIRGKDNVAVGYAIFGHIADDIQQITASAEPLGTVDRVDPPRKEEELQRPTATDISPLTILLEILRRNEPRMPMAEVATLEAVEFMAQLLRRNDYASIPLQLDNNVQDALNLLEFIIYLIDSNLLVREGNRRARSLVVKLGKMGNRMPKSLFLNASEIKVHRPFWPVANGGFADVYEGEFRGNRVALKRVRQKAIDLVFVREALMWRTLSHDYVLPFWGIYQDPTGSDAICLVSPFLENGTLNDWRHNKNPGVPEIEIRILQVAQGIQYLHREGVIHCDLRGCNVLLDHDFHVKIADFGLTRDSNATATASRSMSHQFSAPELFSSNDEEEDRIKRTEKTDVYAFGCLYYEVHFDCLPFGEAVYFYVMNQVMRGRRPRRQADPPLREEAWKLIERCWDQDPGIRPSMDDVADTMISWSI